jgi:vancomycin permeability regulator SanA
VVRALIVTVGVVVLTPPALAARIWYQARLDQRPRSDAIIVLGAAQYNGVPSPTLEWRLRHALTLYRDRVAPMIITVGGKAPGDVYTEAYAGRQWLKHQGVPSASIVAVPEGRNTLASIQAIHQVYKARAWHSAVIVTDPEHSLRSLTMAEDNGIDAATSPTRGGPSVTSRDIQFKYIFRETGGLLWYGTLGRFFGEQ